MTTASAEVLTNPNMAVLTAAKALVGRLKQSLQERNAQIDKLQNSLGQVRQDYSSVQQELQTTKQQLQMLQQSHGQGQQHQGEEAGQQSGEEQPQQSQTASVQSQEQATPNASGADLVAKVEGEKDERASPTSATEMDDEGLDGDDDEIGEDDDDDASMSTMDLLAMELSIAKERIQILEQENEMLYKQQQQMNDQFNSLEENSQQELENQVSGFITQKTSLEDEAMYWKQIATDLQYRTEYAEQQLQQFLLVQQHQQELQLQQAQADAGMAPPAAEKTPAEKKQEDQAAANAEPPAPTSILRSIFGGRNKSSGGDGESTNSRNSNTTGFSSVGFGTVGGAGHTGKGLFASRSLASADLGTITSEHNRDANAKLNNSNNDVDGATGNKEAKTLVRALETRNDALEAKVAKLQSDVIRLQCNHKDESYLKQKELETLKKENMKLLQQLSNSSPGNNNKSTSTHTTMLTSNTSMSTVLGGNISGIGGNKAEISP